MTQTRVRSSAATRPAEGVLVALLDGARPRTVVHVGDGAAGLVDVTLGARPLKRGAVHVVAADLPADREDVVVHTGPTQRAVAGIERVDLVVVASPADAAVAAAVIAALSNDAAPAERPFPPVLILGPDGAADGLATVRHDDLIAAVAEHVEGSANSALELVRVPEPPGTVIVVAAEARRRRTKFARVLRELAAPASVPPDGSPEQIEMLAGELNASRHQLEEARAALAGVEARSEALEHEIDRQRATADALRAELAERTEQVTRGASEVKDWRERLQRLQAAHARDQEARRAGDRTREALERRLAELDHRRSQLEAQLKEADRQRAGLDKQLAESHGRIRELERDVGRAASAVDHAAQQRAALEGRVKAVERELATVRDDARKSAGALQEARVLASQKAESARVAEQAARSASAQLDALERELASRRADGERALIELRRQTAELEKARRQRRQVELDLDAARRDATAARGEVALVEQRAIEAERDLEIERKQLEEAREKRRVLEAKLAGVQSELTARQGELEAARRATARNEQQAQARAADVARLEREIRGLEAATAERDAELGRLRANVQGLEADVAGLQGEVRGLEAATAERDAEIARAGEHTRALEAEGARLARALDETRQRADASEEQGRTLAAELADANARYERLERSSAQRDREREQIATQLALGLADVRQDLERVEQSTAWRLGHAVTRAFRRMTFRRTITEGAVAAALGRIDQVQQQTRALPASLPPAHREGEADPFDRGTSSDPAARRALANRVRQRLGPVRALPAWPKVSVVVVNRNGAHHLERLFDGLVGSTDYPSIEVIVVDNASTDRSRDLLAALNTPFDVRVIPNDRNATFSEANNAAACQATGELLLFLNNDVEPFEPLWLQELVACLDHEQVDAAGAVLLYTEETAPPGATEPYATQHRGVRFGSAAGLLRGENLGIGEPPLGRHLGQVAACPAVTAACLLIRRESFDSVGGFPDGYRYGTEDVDLGLRLTEGGRRVVCTGRSLLLHAESATQDMEGREFKRSNRTLNRQLFLERWGPRLRREYWLDRLDTGGFWTEGGPHIGITVTSLDPGDGYGDWYTAHELGDALEKLGWRVTYVQRKHDEWYSLPADLDCLLVLLDAYDFARAGDVTTVAWIRNWTERWISRPSFRLADIVLASSRRSAEIVARETGKSAVVFPLATNPERFRPLPPRADLACDYAFTGNRWNRPRAVEKLAEWHDGRRLRVFGRGWEGSSLHRHCDGHVSYDELPAVYSSAKLVLDDAAEHALPYDAVNSRVFDALAAGTLVVSNCADGVRELFDEEFPTWTTSADLRTRLDALLSDDERRRRLVDRYRTQVLERHTYVHRARELTGLLRQRAEALSFCIKIGAPDWERAQQWGDLYFARGVQRQLEKRGHRCLIQILPEWGDLAGCSYDVVVHLKGLSRYSPKPGQFNVLWNISHPELITGEECDGYDLVFVASERFAERLRRVTSTPVAVLEQATDPNVFFPDPDEEHRHELAFVGNSRKVRRRILEDLLPTSHDLAIWGGEWEGLVDPRHVRGAHVPNTELRRVYSSAAIVLNDHWDDMRAEGFISNRIYDALACSALVLSDDVPGIRERFGDAVVTYRTREELHAHVERLLASPEERRARAERGRALVLGGHTFAHRVDALMEELMHRFAEAGFATRIGPVRERMTV